MPRSYLIIGGSIAGAATAYFLAVGQPDARIVVVERSPGFRDGGQNIDVRAEGKVRCLFAVSLNVQAVLRAMGLFEAVKAKNTSETGTRFVDENGQTVAAFMADGSFDGPTAELEILRGDLARLMVDKATALGNVEIRYDTTVTAIDDDGQRVRVEFSTGASEDFDVLIAADGCRSRTRDLFIPKCAPAPSYSS